MRSGPATIVLLHGMGRTRLSMRTMAAALRRRGHRVLNLGYPSRSANLHALAALVARDVRAAVPETAVHFVTHSLGGILLRVAIAEGHLPLEGVRRVVMIAPPNGGSHLVDAFNRRPLLRAFYRLMTGPAGQELGVACDGVVRALPPLPFETGIIAGSRSLNPLFSRVLPGASDGKVCVSHAAAPGMRQLIVVPHSHSFIMRANVVLAQTASFIETGSFG